MSIHNTPKLAQPKVKTRGWRRLRMTLIAMLVLGLLTGASVFAFQSWGRLTPSTASMTLPEQQKAAIDAIAANSGIRFTQVMVTANGGLVDVRYQVIDPDKAKTIFDKLETAPRLRAENGVEISMASPPQRHSLTAGVVYYLLYRNVDGAIKPGSAITILIGKDIKLPKFKVEG
jgi:hypothetical protein